MADALGGVTVLLTGVEPGDDEAFCRDFFMLDFRDASGARAAVDFRGGDGLPINRWLLGFALA